VEVGVRVGVGVFVLVGVDVEEGREVWVGSRVGVGEGGDTIRVQASELTNRVRAAMNGGNLQGDGIAAETIMRFKECTSVLANLSDQSVSCWTSFANCSTRLSATRKKAQKISRV